MGSETPLSKLRDARANEATSCVLKHIAHRARCSLEQIAPWAAGQGMRADATQHRGYSFGELVYVWVTGVAVWRV